MEHPSVRTQKMDQPKWTPKSAQSDGTIEWNCTADLVSVEALDKRYLPETCKDKEDEEEKDGEE